MRISNSRLDAILSGALCSVTYVLLLTVPVLTGCKGFFVPECQELNDCSTTTTATTSTTASTSSTGSTSSTSSTSSTASTSSTGSTSSTSSTSSTASTSSTGSTGSTSSTSSTASTSSTGSTGTTSTATVDPQSGLRSLLVVHDANSAAVKTLFIARGQVIASSSNVFQTANGDTPAAVTGVPNRSILFMATAQGSIFADTMGADGNLQPANGGQSLANVPNPAILATDRSGKLLLVVSHAPALSVFRIDAANETLQPSSQGAIALDSGAPTQLYLAPDNRSVLIAMGQGGVDRLAFNAQTGTVQNHVHIAPLNAGAAQDNDVASSGDGALLFIGEKGAGIRVLKIGASGATTEISGSPFASQFGMASSLVVSPGNSRLYVAYPSANKLATYSIAMSGALTLASTMPFSPSPSPTALSLDAAGTHVLALTNRATIQSVPISGGTGK